MTYTQGISTTSHLSDDLNNRTESAFRMIDCLRKNAKLTGHPLEKSRRLMPS
jgi:hypothetical protein